MIVIFIFLYRLYRNAKKTNAKLRYDNVYILLNDALSSDPCVLRSFCTKVRKYSVLFICEVFHVTPLPCGYFIYL